MLGKTATKFIISGSTAALVNFGTFFILNSFFSVYYLLSSVVAFSVAAIASFCLQKFWTFEDQSFRRVHIQFSLFVGIISLNLGLNTLLVYLFVSLLGLSHLLSQILAGILVALESFFVFRHIIFKQQLEDITEKDV